MGTDGETSANRISMNPEKTNRRSIYLPLRRSNLPTLYTLFDFGDAATPDGKRSSTTVATQALFVMNSPLVMREARSLALAILKQESAGKRRMEELYLQSAGSPARRARNRSARTFVRPEPCAKNGTTSMKCWAWTSLMHALMASNESSWAACVLREPKIWISDRLSARGPKRFLEMSRRAMLRAAGCGFGYLGLQSMLSDMAQAADDPLAPKSPMFPARAKRVIFLFMHGGPSSIDTFDPKPYLDANDGKPLPIKQPLTFAAKTGGLMKSPWKFKNCGQSGMPISDLLPNIREHADDLCVVRSMVGEGVDHGAALLQTFTGTFTFTRPSMGSWMLYGLGSQNRNLLGYISIKPALSHGGSKNWAS